MDLAMRLGKWLDARADEMAELVCELVAIPTENPPGRELAVCAKRLRDRMAPLGLAPRLVELPEERALDGPAVVHGEAGEGSRTVYFHGHYDVVPAQDPSQFMPARDGGRISGRGTADMKGGLVSMLYGAAALQGAGAKLDGRIVFNLVPDEETGSTAGSGYLARERLIDPAALAMVTAEPTGGVIWHANRGAITLAVTLEGREAHSGRAHEGVNAFEAMLDVAAPLRELAQQLRTRRTAYPLDSEAARASMLVIGGAAGSGAGFNVVPGSAWFSVDRRFNPEEDLDEEIERLQHTVSAAAEAAGATVHVDVLQRAPSAATPKDHPAAQALAQIVGQVGGREARFELCPGVLETRWYARNGVPAFAYGPGELAISHGPQEFIEEAAMRRCALVYALFAAELLA